tara:strand:+ start:657 stop:794 length:138 start_codon:yes stop_codon:yes gene_type:complete
MNSYEDYLLSKIDVIINNNIKIRRVNGTIYTKQKKILPKEKNVNI